MGNVAHIAQIAAPSPSSEIFIFSHILQPSVLTIYYYTMVVIKTKGIATVN